MYDESDLDLLEREREYLASEQAALDARPWDDRVPEVPAELLLDLPVELLTCECCGSTELVFRDPAAADPPASASAEAGWAVPGLAPDLSTEPAGPALAGPVAALVELVAGLEVGPGELPPGQALAEAEALLGVLSRLRTALLPRLADVHSRQLYELAGRRSTSGWLRQVAPDAPTGDVLLGRRLQTLRSLDGAVRAGQVSLGGAQQVRKALDKLRRHLDRPDGLIDGQPGEPAMAQLVANVAQLVAAQHHGLADDAPLLLELDAQLSVIVLSALDGVSQVERCEQALTLLGTHLPPGEVLGAALEQQVSAFLPNELERQQQAAQDRRSLSLTPKTGGGWRLQADLSPEAGERLHTVLAAEARRDSHNPLDTEAWQALRAHAAADGVDVLELLEHRSTPSGPSDKPDPPLAPDGSLRPGEAWGIDVPDDPLTERSDGTLRRPRSRGTRLHDAFDNLLDRYLSSGLGGQHGKVPVQVAVTASSALVDGTPGALPVTGGSGRPLARNLLRRWWCDAHVTVLLMSRGFTPLGVVHSGRTLTGQERKASLVQFDRRCAGTECCPTLPDPLTPLEPHHLIRYTDAGRTSIGETIWVCPTLHHDLHTGHRTVQLRDGTWIDEHGTATNPHDQPGLFDA